MIALVERFYDPVHGQVLLDGRDLKTLDLEWVRAHMGLVSQEPNLFEGTIRENILFGRPGATDEEVEEAARAANAHDFIMRQTDGYDTLVGERGMQLSGTCTEEGSSLLQSASCPTPIPPFITAAPYTHLPALSL